LVRTYSRYFISRRPRRGYDLRNLFAHLLRLPQSYYHDSRPAT
jgi:hypothetical protein